MESKERLDIDALRLKAALEKGDRAAFSGELYEYLLKRFGLSSLDADGEQRIEKLARISLVNQWGERTVRNSERAINCANASSAEEKALLFILVTKNRLELSLSPKEIARIETVSQLTESFWTAYATEQNS